jgi:ribosomal-protein-alanine N-acetyltransferase
MDSEIIGEDFLDFKCPYCGSLNSFPTSTARLARECMNCLELFLVPSADGAAARKLPLPAESPTIRLRKFQPTDWKDLLEFQFEDEDDATGWIHRVTTIQPTENRLLLFLAIETKSSRKVVGTLGLGFTDRNFSQAELSPSFNRAASVPGWELDALDVALDFCFQELHLHRVFTQCQSEDFEDRQLFTAAGMRQEAEFLKNQFISGEWATTIWFAMLEEDYFTETPAEHGKTS